MATTLKMESQNMCFGCPSLCCRISAALTVFDIIRICESTGEPARDFVIVDPVAKDALGFRALNQTMEFFLLRPHGSCIFLQGRPQPFCSIEEFKPGVCITYPFSLRDGKAQIRKDALCLPNNLKKADFEKMSPSLLDDCQYELERYVEIIDEWNSLAEGHEAPEEFLNFAVHELDLMQKPLIGRHLWKLRCALRKVLKKRP
jgi:Fe-S-cluster containining protein